MTAKRQVAVPGPGIVAAAALALALLVLTPPAPSRAAGAGQRGARGSLVLRLAGLPPGEHASVTVTGPPQAGRHRFRRHLASAARVVALRVVPGVYRVEVARVHLRRSHAGARRGATALPTRRRLKATVHAGRRARLTLAYGTIVNPGVRGVSGKIARVLGKRSSPSAVVLRPGKRVRRGAILSARPSGQLPVGLLARVVAVKEGPGGETAILKPASIYEVAPNMSFDVPLTASSEAAASQVLKCSDPSAGVAPYANLSDFHVSGGWITHGWGFAKVTTGANAELHFHAAAGVKVSSHSGLSCSLNLPAFGFQGMAGPIPVYGGIRPSANAEIAASATMNAGLSTDVTIGAKVDALPPHASPVIDFGSPRFEYGATLFAGVKAGLGLSAELGIGAIDAANIHVDLTNDLDFTAAPGQCSWDLDLGRFSATGELGPLSISTPSTPGFHKNLWHQSCGPPPPPPPPPAPAPPAGPTLPLLRATMAWETDADVDLYAWDEAGNLLYWLDREGIPGAELVEDVIPAEGEYAHPPEQFFETASPGRRYTFGICDFHREGGDVALTVDDPDGGSRVFHRTLAEEGDGAVITTSPLGLGYEPEPGWCRYLGEPDEELEEEF